MNQELFFDNEFVNICWDKEIKAVISSWKQPAKDNDFRNGLLKTLELAIKKGATKLLSDTLNAGVSSPQDMEWVNTVFNKKVNNESKLKYLAFIIPKSAITKLSINKTMNVIKEENKQTAQYFASIQEARQWLAGSD